MPYVSHRVRNTQKDKVLLTKVYGPHMEFIFDSQHLKTCLLKLVNDNENPNTLVTRAAYEIGELVKDDPNVTWVECELATTEGDGYGDVAVVRAYEDALAR